MKLLIAILFLFSTTTWAADTAPEKKGAKDAGAKQETRGEEDEQEEDKVVNLESEDAFIDLSDALKSKHFVRRAILNTAIKNSSRFHLGKPYVNHLVGFDAIINLKPVQKTVTAMQSLGGGYVFPFGLGVESGLEFSSLSDWYLGTRWYFDQVSAFVWPFAGAGLAVQLDFLSVSDPTQAVAAYSGSPVGFFANFGLMIPLVDIGLKAEIRANMYGGDRIIITTGLGAVLFI
ncbi:MAG: hypothetical protein HYR96_06000 [Deltaproteobacteria bacterium]|nr:hypothetical protein [Deltaproteobacteria bacterium]MBI3293110.1 hypothetical protein [Deltaproteobacteria bacterium]